MRKCLCLLVAAAVLLPLATQAVPAFNECILIDFNKNDAPDAVGADFNAALGMAVADPATPAIIFLKSDVDGTNAVEGITITSSGGIGSHVAGTFGAVAGSGLLNDYLYLRKDGGGSLDVDITLSGLNLAPDMEYDLWLFGTGDSPNQQSGFTYDGVRQSTPADDPGNPADVTKWDVHFLVSAGADRDTLTVNWDNDDTRYSGFNGLALKVVPEPGTIALLSLGLLALLRRQR